MPTRICLEPRCPNVAAYRGRCGDHARSNERTIQRSGYKLYRTKRWELTRRSYLFDHPLCECDDQTCHGIATDVHHRVDLNAGGDPWNAANLQALTHACHSKLTRGRQTN